VKTHGGQLLLNMTHPVSNEPLPMSSCALAPGCAVKTAIAIASAASQRRGFNRKK
jgi:hypothetical protein